MEMQQGSQGKRHSARKRVAGNYFLVYFLNMPQCYHQTASFLFRAGTKSFHKINIFVNQIAFTSVPGKCLYYFRPFLQGDQQTILLLIILRSKIYDDDDDLNSLGRTFLQKSFVVLTEQGFKL